MFFGKQKDELLPRVGAIQHPHAKLALQPQKSDFLPLSLLAFLLSSLANPIFPLLTIPLFNEISRTAVLVGSGVGTSVYGLLLLYSNDMYEGICVNILSHLNGKTNKHSFSHIQDLVGNNDEGMSPEEYLCSNINGALAVLGALFVVAGAWVACVGWIKKDKRINESVGELLS